MVQNSKLGIYATALVVIVLAYECSGFNINTAIYQAFSLGHTDIIGLTTSDVADTAEELKNSPSKETVEHLRKRRQSDNDDFFRFLLCLFQYYDGLLNNSHCNASEPNATDYSTTDQYLSARNNYYEQTCKPECIALNNELYECLDIGFTKAELDYLDDINNHWTCARIESDGDFCPVHLTRVYGADEEDEAVENVWKACGDYEPLSNRSDPNCQGTNCMQLASDFRDKMGCCSTLALGNITRCIDTPELCTYVYSSASGGYITASATVLLLMVVVLATAVLG